MLTDLLRDPDTSTVHSELNQFCWYSSKEEERTMPNYRYSVKQTTSIVEQSQTAAVTKN